MVMLQLGFENVGVDLFKKLSRGIGIDMCTWYYWSSSTNTIFYLCLINYKLFQICTKTIIMELSYPAMLISQLPF